MRLFPLFLAILFSASTLLAAENETSSHRAYSGYVERWQSVGTTRYALMNANGEAIVYIGDDYPDDLGNKRDVRNCLNEAVTTGARVEIGGAWVKLAEGVEGFDEQTITCRILEK